jgi:SAM-dependent methyltransferase
MTRDWHAWLLDRALHRAPVDEHFNQAIEITNVEADRRLPLLELGPGPESDISDRMGRLGWHVIGADTRPATDETIDLSETWPDPVSGVRSLPFAPATFAAVFAREVFEHVDHLDTMLKEVYRVLVPGGILFFSTPFIFPLHDYETGDYWRISDTGWKIMLERRGFVSIYVKNVRFMFDSWQLPASVVGMARRKTQLADLTEAMS